jgi:hypothetical protein
MNVLTIIGGVTVVLLCLVSLIVIIKVVWEGL